MLTLKSPPEPKSKPRLAAEAPRTRAAVVIEYCVPGNYERVARRLAAAIEKEFRVAVELVPSRGGVFEVEVGGRLIFSKRATWRLPENDEIFYHVRELPAR